MNTTIRNTWPMFALVGVFLLVTTGAGSGGEETTSGVESARAVLGKWIETQQIITHERNEWQQGREILGGRVDLLRREYSVLREKLEQVRQEAADTEAKRTELLAGEAELKAMTVELAAKATKLEAVLSRLRTSLPDPTQKRIAPLFQRIPTDPDSTRVSVAERFQNVLGILNEVNKDATELKVEFEVRDLADGKSSEVRTLYVGLAQAYYVSAGGEAGIGRPGSSGWTWQPSKAIAGDVLTALDIIQGKHSPVFVPLPTRIQ